MLSRVGFGERPSARAPNKDKARIGRASLTYTGDIDVGGGRGASRKLCRYYYKENLFGPT